MDFETVVLSGLEIWDRTAYKSVRSDRSAVPQSGPASLSKGTRRSGSRGCCKSGCKGGFVVGHLSYQAVMKPRLLGALVARLSRCWGLSQDTRLLSHRSVG